MSSDVPPVVEPEAPAELAEQPASRKHTFAHRQSAAAKAYAPTLVQILEGLWLRFVLRAPDGTDDLDLVNIKLDAFSSVEELRSSIDFLLGKKPDFAFTQSTLLPLLDQRPDSIWHNLSPESRAKLSTSNSLQRWLYLKKPYRGLEEGLSAAEKIDEKVLSADSTWKWRHGASPGSIMPAHEQKDLDKLYTKHVAWLGIVLFRRCIATHAVLIAYKASSERLLAELELPDKLKATLLVSVLGYVTVPTEFAFLSELCETLLQNQLAFHDDAKRATKPKKKKQKPDSENPAEPTDAQQPAPSLPPLRIVAFPERPLPEVFKELVAQFERVHAELKARYDAYQYCCTAVPKEIKKTNSETSNFSQVCRWVTQKLSASQTHKLLSSEIRQKSILFTRILKFIGTHFDIVVAGKHGLCLSVAEVNPEFAKRGARVAHRIDTTAMRAKLDQLLKYHQDRVANLIEMRAQFLEVLQGNNNNAAVAEAPALRRQKLVQRAAPSPSASAGHEPNVDESAAGDEEAEEDMEEAEPAAEPAAPYVYTDDEAYAWK